MVEPRGRVLCVDDEPNIVRALQWLLQKDFDVQTAGSALEGIELVRKNDFDVVISDQRMPGMTGVEFLREVRRDAPRAIRILLTGYSDLQAILRSVNESEIFRFINKPWNISELPKVVEQAVEIARTRPVEQPDPEPAAEAPIVAARTDSVLLIDEDPATTRLIESVVGTMVRLHSARSLSEAVDLLNRGPVSVIISETRVGGADATRLIRLMKQKYPETVSVVFSAQSDAETVTTLINEGQIFRFMPKPVEAGYLKLVINSALSKHRRLAETPGLAARHAVVSPAAAELEALVREVPAAAGKATPATVPGPTSEGILGRVSVGFRRLLGR